MKIKIITKCSKFSFILSSVCFLSLIFLIYSFPQHKMLLKLIKILLWSSFIFGILFLLLFVFVMNKVRKTFNSRKRFDETLKQKYGQNYILKKLFLFSIITAFTILFFLKHKPALNVIMLVIIFIYFLNLIRILLNEALAIIETKKG